MANSNDFKLVNLKSKKMYEFLKINKDITDVQKSRLGFYHLVLENVTGIRDVENVSKMIIDTDYNRIVYGITFDDLGIDAVNINGDIDSAESTIQLFNFKFREKFKEDKNKEEDSIKGSMKFLQYLSSDNSDIMNLPDDRVRQFIIDINKLLDSNSMCQMTLYMISNENNGFSVSTDKFIKVLEKDYDLKIVNIGLDDIIGYFTEKRSKKICKFAISPNDFLSFEADELSTQKSYIIKMSLVDLIRITGKDDSLAQNCNIEDDTLIENSSLDFSLLYDNVRGYLGATDYNMNIQSTLMKNHKEFFMLNNGLTFTAAVINSEEKNSGKRYLFTLENFQIVNGGQTIRSIYAYLKTDESSSKINNLRDTFVLVRIFKISEDDELKNRIAEYTNSQNAIASSDLKSVDAIQIQIERYFKEEKILYARKAGELGDENIEYVNRISKEKLSQILYSAFGFPDRASNQKKRLFQEYYGEIFYSTNFSLEKAVEYTRLYFEIEDMYNKFYSQYKYFEQKGFYIIYLCVNFNLTIQKSIENLEEELKKDKSGATDARILLKGKFKMNLESKFKI